MSDGGLQYWQQLGQQEAELEDRRNNKLAILANKYAAAKTACELIMRDDIDDIATAKAQASWALDQIKQLEAA